MVWIAWRKGRLRWPLPRVKPAHVLVGFLAAWLVVKLVFVHAIVPRRDDGRSPRARAEQIAALVPEGETLYLCDLKDEGILFYYGRPARRVASWDDLSGAGQAHYCILTGPECAARPFVPLLSLRDEQGDPIVLAQVGGDPARRPPAARRSALIAPPVVGAAAEGALGSRWGLLRCR